MERRRFKKTTNHGLRKRIFCKMDQNRYPCGQFERRPLRIWKVVKIMKKIELPGNIHNTALDHWNALLDAEQKVNGKIKDVFVDVTCRKDANEDPIADDDSLSSESPPPPEEIDRMRRPMRDEEGEISMINLRAVQIIMRHPVVIAQDAHVLSDLSPLDGPSELQLLRVATLGEEEWIPLNP